MKLILIAISLFWSASSFATCITLDQAKTIASIEINMLETNDPQGDYFLWQDAVENLELSNSMYSSTVSLSNYEDLRISVSCDGTFDYETNYTEN